MELGFIVFAIAVVLAVRLIAGGFDGERIERYVHERGWELLDKSWDPLGPGWFGEQDSRIYEIVYKDEAGNTHKASVKTSMLSGVYLTNDVIIEQVVRSEMTDLEKENQRLKQELETLRKNQSHKQ